MSGVSLHLQSRSWWSGLTHLAWSTTVWARSGLLSSQVLCTHFFFFCFVAKQFRSAAGQEVDLSICLNPLLFRNKQQSITAPCCHRRPHQAAWRELDWTEGLDQPSLLLFCKDSGQFSVHFMCRRHYSLSKYIIMRLIFASQCLTLLRFLCVSSWKLFSVCCYKCCF